MRSREEIQAEIEQERRSLSAAKSNIKSLEAEIAALDKSFPRIALGSGLWTGEVHLVLGTVPTWGRYRYLSRRIHNDGHLGNPTHGIAICDGRSGEPNWLDAEAALEFSARFPSRHWAKAFMSKTAR